jgi:Flp pilus assembly pilin Flp
MQQSDSSAAGESGQAVLEYGILLALISVGAIIFLPGISGVVTTMYQSVRDAIQSVI